MGVKRLQALQAEESRLRTAMNVIENVAVEAGRDLNEDETSELGTLRASYDECSRNIADAASDIERHASTAAILNKLAPADDEKARLAHTRSHGAPCTPGEYAALYLRSTILHDPEAAAQFDELLRAAGDETSTEGAGVLPTYIIGDVVKFIDSNRYAWNAARKLPMPEKGSAFKRPRVTAFTQVGAQSSELGALPARSLTLTGDSVSKTTAGGFVHLSEQIIDWSEPAMLGIVLLDLAQQYAIDTETVITAAIAAAATNTVNPGGASTTSFDDTPAHFIPTLASAVSGTYSRAKKLPDVLFAAPDVWGKLLGMVDTTGRPIFPTLSAMNAPGQLEATSFDGKPMSLQLVVSPEFTSGFCAVGVSQFVEAYEQDKGLAQLNDPQHLGLNIAYRGYVASNVYANGLTALVATP